MTTRPASRRSRLRFRLALGTALAGGTLLVAPLARAQELPTGGTVISGAAVIAPPVGSSVEVALAAPSTVINWNSFSVVGQDAANRATVNFSQAGPTAANAVVVNRVIGTTRSTIENGSITTNGLAGKENTSVWLLNPNGVLVGGGGVVDVGSFFASTLDICASANCSDAVGAGNLRRLSLAPDPADTTGIRLATAAGSSAAVQLQGNAQVLTTGALVMVGGSVQLQPGTTVTAGGEVNLVAATDVQVRRAGSPLVFQINAGSAVGGTLVSAGGTVSGSTVVMAAAQPDSLVESLLSVTGSVTATGVATGPRGVVLLGGTGAVQPGATPPLIAIAAGQGGPVGVTATGTLTADAQDVLVNGTGAVTVAGGVSAVGDYRVAGSSVTLGGTGVRAVQDADGLVSVRSNAGTVQGLGTLTLRSNRGGTTGGALTLSSADGIAFGTDTTLMAGNGNAAGAADIFVAEGAGASTTSFGTITARSLGRVLAAGETAPQPLTLYGATTFGTVALDRALDLTVLTGGAAGTLTAASITTGVNPADDGSGVNAIVDSLRLTAAGNVSLGAADSRTGNVTITARDGDVTGLSGGYTALYASRARPASAGEFAIGDGSVQVFAGRSAAGTQTATGSNGLARIGSAIAGADVTILAQKIDAATIRAAAASGTPVTGTVAAGSATLHAYAHDATAGAIDLRVSDAAVGAGTLPRQGADLSLIADAASGTVAAGTLAADRSVSVLAGNGANGTASVVGSVSAGRLDATGGYSVTAGEVTLGSTGASVVQAAPGAVTITSRAGSIAGLGTLMLQSNTDGTGTEALRLESALAIAFAPTSQVLGGNGTAAGNSDLLVREGAGAAATAFGTVRARSLASTDGSSPLVLYGTTRLGNVDLDRSLALSVVAGGGQPGTLTGGALRVGVHPLADASGTAVADSLSLTTAGDARLQSATSLTGSVAITAVDGDVTGLASAGGFARVALSAAHADGAATPRIADGSITVLAGRNASGNLTATGTNGLALIGDALAGAAVRIDAQAIDATRVEADRGALTLAAHAADSAVVGAAAEVLTVGTARAGLAGTLTAEAGSIRVATLEAGRAATLGTTSGAVRVDAAANVRAGSVTTQVGDLTITSARGDVTGAGTAPSYGRADLSAVDGSILVTAGAGAAGSGSVLLGTVVAQTSETAAATGPARGTIRATGRVLDISRAETAGTTVGDGGGGSLYLEAREGQPSSDARLTLGTGLVGTTATLVAAAGSLGDLSTENGSIAVGTLEAGRNGLVGSGTALAGTIQVDAANNVRADALTSRTGSVVVTARGGDVSGTAATGRMAITAAQAIPASGSALAIADGSITLDAQSGLQGRGVARLGEVLAGGDVAASAEAIDADGQSARSVAGSVRYLALGGDLSLGSGSAGLDVILDATTDAAGVRGAGTITAGTLTAGRNVVARGDADVALTDDVTAGTAGAGYYRVAGRNVRLGSDGTAAALADRDLQSAADDVAIVATGDIVAAQGLVLRSNRLGQADGTGSDAGTRGLSLDAGGALSLSLPEGLSLAGRDAVATRLIGGSDAAPQQSVVQVRAGAGTAMVLGNVTARALRGVASGVLAHAGDIRAGSVAVADTLTISAADPGFTGDRLLQIDSASTTRGSIDLSASGVVRGYQLVAPSATVPLGVYVPTAITAGGDRADVRAGSAILGDVRAGAAAALTTTTGTLRVATVATGTTLPIDGSGIALSAATDLRVTSAAAARGNVTATARDGSVTGLAVPDDGTIPTGFAQVTRLAATDGIVSVAALGTAAASGLVDAATITAASSEPPTTSAPLRGAVDVTGQRLSLGTVAAGAGSLNLSARQGGATAVLTGITLASGAAGTAATVTAEAGSLAAASQANGSVTIGTLVAGSNRLSGGASAIPGTVAVTAAGNVRAGTIASGTGSLTVTARDGDVTGLLDTATGLYRRTNLIAAIASTPTGAPAIGDGAVSVYAGRSAGEVATATGTNGLAFIDTATAGGAITIGAQAVDASSLLSQSGGIAVEAAADDNVVAGGGGEAVAIGSAFAALDVRLSATTGSIRVGLAAAGQGTGSAIADLVTDARRNVRIADGSTRTGDVRVTARTGDITGLIDGGTGLYTRATLAALAADRSVSALAGPTASGVAPAAGSTGLAYLGTVSADGAITLGAEAIDATRAVSTSGAINATAYAADTSVAGSGGEALALGQALSGLGTTLDARLGSVRVGGIDAGRLAGSAASDVTLTAARDIRVGSALARTGNLSATAVDGDTTGLFDTSAGAFGRAALSAAGDATVYAGRSAAGMLTAAGTRGLAKLGTVAAGGSVTLRAQAIDAIQVEAATGPLVARAYAADNIVPNGGGEALVIGTALSGGTVSLSTEAGSVRLANIVAGRVRNGIAGDIMVESSADARLGSVQSSTGSVTVTARGDVTGLLDSTGSYGRAVVRAAEADAVAPAIAAGNVAIYAGRDSAGNRPASAGNGLARLDIVSAGNDVTILAQAIDANRIDATAGTLTARAFAADGAVAGSAGGALVVAAAGSGLDTRLTSTGSIRVTTADAGRLADGTGDLRLTAQRNIRIAQGNSSTGSIAITAVDGDVIGLVATDGTIGRAVLSATRGAVSVLAGRDAAGGQTATGSNGLARLDTVTAAGTIGVSAQAIDAGTTTTDGAVALAAYAAENLPGSGGEALVLGQAFSGLGTTLDARTGSIRADVVDAGRAGVGNVLATAERNIRLGVAQSRTGTVTAAARDGALTGLFSTALGDYGRADLRALAATGDVLAFAGFDATGAPTATGPSGLARLGTVTAGNAVTIQAQASDTTSATAANGALLVRTVALDGAVPGSQAESLVLGIGTSGVGTTLVATNGSIRAGTIVAGTRRGVIGDLLVDAARDVRLGVGSSTTGSIAVLARDGDVTGLASDGTRLTAAIGTADATQPIADGAVAVFAGRTSAGVQTASGTNGLARIDSVTAGGDVTVRAQAIDATTIQAAAAGTGARVAGGSALLQAYGTTARAGGVDLRVASAAAGTGNMARTGSDVQLIASADGGRLLATTVAADRGVLVRAGTGVAGSAGDATITRDVVAGRLVATGSYNVTGGSVTLGTADTAVAQAAAGGVTITSTLGDVVGLGASDAAGGGLTLRANGDGVGSEPLVLSSARAVLFAPSTRVLAGNYDALGTASGRSDIQVGEGGPFTVAASSFGEVRGRSLGGIPGAGANAPVPLTIYGATTFGTVAVDRSLTLSVLDGSTAGSLTMGPVSVGANPVATPDTLLITSVGTARFASVTNTTGPIALEVTRLGQDLIATDAISGKGQVSLRAARTIATPRVGSIDGGVQIVAQAGDAAGDSVSAASLATINAGGLARYATISAGTDATVDATRIDIGGATTGAALLLRATGADTANAEALVLGTGTTGTTAVLATTGSVRVTSLDTGLAGNGTLGGIVLNVARNIRLGSARARTGAVFASTIDGDLTGLVGADGGYGRAVLTAPAGLVGIYVGRTSSGVRTATGSNGLVRVDSVTANSAVTIGAEAIDAARVEATGGALALTAYAADGAVTGGAGEALVVDTARAGGTAALAATAGSVRATTLAAGTVRGTAGSLSIEAARNARLDTGSSGTGNVTVTTRNGDVTGLATNGGFGRATLTAATASAASSGQPAVSDGTVGVYAGVTAAGTPVATAGNGLARLATVSAGNDVTVLAQKIDVTAVQAAASPSVAGGASGTATLHAYAHDATGGAVDLSVGSVAAGTGSAARAGRDVLLTADAANGTLSAGTIAADRSVAVIAGSGTNGSATIAGGVTAGRADAAGSYAVTAGNVTLGTAGATATQSAAAATTIAATTGSVTGSGTLTLQSNRDGIGAESLAVSAAGGNIAFNPASTLVGGAGSSGSPVTLTATGNGANITTGTVSAVGRAATLTAAGAITTNGPVTAATLTAQAGGAATLNGAITAQAVTLRTGGTLATNGTVVATTLSAQVDGAAMLNGAVTAPTVTVQAGGPLTTNGTIAATTLALRSASSVTVNAAASATTAALRATGLATIAAPLTAGTVTVQSGNIAINATLGGAGATVNLFDQATAANPIRLGSAAVDDTGFSLSQAELARVSAATLLIGSGADDNSGETVPTGTTRQDVVIGTLALGAATGTTAVKVLGTGSNTLSVTGAVTLAGSAARTLQLGGAAANQTGEVGRLQIVNASNSAAATLAILGAASGGEASTGSITTDPAATVDLRAAVILAGNPGFINDVGAAGSDVSSRLISNPNSSLYGAGANGYVSAPAVPLITTGRLRVQFSNVALLQNTSRPGSIASGVVITGQPSSTADGQPLLIRSSTSAQSNGFSLFGVFQPGASGTRFINEQAALLGGSYISIGSGTQGSVNPSAARINGCLIASASGGCLATSIAQPTLNVFDVSRDQVLRGSDNLTVTFDPLVGSNNEALFGDIAAGDSTFTEDPCPDGTVSPQCKTTGDRK